MKYTQEIENNLPDRLDIFHKKFINAESSCVLLKDSMAGSYHLYDMEEEIEYVIDGEIIYDDQDEINEDAIISLEELINLDDIDTLKEMAWTKYSKEGNKLN